MNVPFYRNLRKMSYSYNLLIYRHFFHQFTHFFSCRTTNTESISSKIWYLNASFGLKPPSKPILRDSVPHLTRFYLSNRLVPGFAENKESGKYIPNEERPADFHPSANLALGKSILFNCCDNISSIIRAPFNLFSCKSLPRFCNSFDNFKRMPLSLSNSLSRVSIRRIFSPIAITFSSNASIVETLCF